jgi:1-aminocyclopropane-1-carboxylate deaminase/D-cysteine desulfhydrase-like pyridoxal-dependent ACC family enzyme
MTSLVERWPRLSALPHLAIGSFPTPIVHLAQLSPVIGADVWCKRDDRSGSSYGGNKVRKLEFLLGQALAEGADAVVTIGRAGSHHVLATAIYGRAQGLEVHALVLPQVRTPHVERNVRAQLAAGAVLHPIFHPLLWPAAMAALATRLKLRGKRVFLIGPGGSDATGALGYVEAGIEIGEQLLRDEVPELDAVYVPLGTGGTAVGLAVGLAAMGVMAEVVAVRVTPRGWVTRGLLAALARRVVQRLRGHDERFPSVADLAMRNLRIEEGFLGEGYGIATGAGREAIRIAAETESLELDPSYTSKTLAALIAHGRTHRRGQKLLYLHTLNSRPLEPLLERALPIPPRIERLWR